ncbi:hypothetical protein, partial [Paenibacillus spiritus]|uniref:hypothetical protein n=1 Tax=Paenibacillus spiritus TaxID=2496557 RepID=UPI001CC48518
CRPFTFTVHNPGHSSPTGGAFYFGHVLATIVSGTLNGIFRNQAICVQTNFIHFHEKIVKHSE